MLWGKCNLLSVERCLPSVQQYPSPTVLEVTHIQVKGMGRGIFLVVIPSHPRTVLDLDFSPSKVKILLTCLILAVCFHAWLFSYLPPDSMYGGIVGGGGGVSPASSGYKSMGLSVEEGPSPINPSSPHQNTFSISVSHVRAGRFVLSCFVFKISLGSDLLINIIMLVLLLLVFCSKYFFKEV